MISPEQLHAYLEKLDKGVAAVDLLKIGQSYALNSAHQAFNGKIIAHVLFLKKVDKMILHYSEDRHECQDCWAFSRCFRHGTVS